MPVLDVATRYTELGEALLPLINPVIAAQVRHRDRASSSRTSRVPPEVEEAIDKRSSMAAVGNLNDYVKYQMAKGMADRRAAAAPAAWRPRWRSGFAIAQQMMQQQGGVLGSTRLPRSPSGAQAAAGAAARRRGLRRARGAAGAADARPTSPRHSA